MLLLGVFIKISLNKDTDILDDSYTSSPETSPDWLVSLTFNMMIWWEGRKWRERMTEKNMVVLYFSYYIKIPKCFLFLSPVHFQTLFTLSNLFSYSIVLPILQFFKTSQCCNILVICPDRVLSSFLFFLRNTDYSDSWQLFCISLCKKTEATN